MQRVTVGPTIWAFFIAIFCAYFLRAFVEAAEHASLVSITAHTDHKTEILKRSCGRNLTMDFHPVIIVSQSEASTFLADVLAIPAE